MDYKKLLAAYRSLWVNRELKTVEGNEKETLLEAIERDLKDENAHPRVRKAPHAKFFWATKRIGQGAISDEEKLRLIHIHIEIVERLDQS